MCSVRGRLSLQKEDLWARACFTDPGANLLENEVTWKRLLVKHCASATRAHTSLSTAVPGSHPLLFYYTHLRTHTPWSFLSS